jgi:hypothetical protein
VIFPDHCKFVGVRDCVEDDCEPKIGDKVYFSSKYQITFLKRRAAIYKVTSLGEGLIREIQAVHKIAGFDDTLIFDTKVDIFNRGKLIKQTVRLCNDKIKAVVYQGFDEHWTFVFEPDLACLKEVEIFDIAPPDPPYLVTLVKQLDDVGVFGDLSVSFKPRVLDLKHFTEATIFPCTASGLGSNHLDARDVKLSSKNVLVGCDISREVFEQRYNGVMFVHINICPMKTINPERVFIAKCCKTERSGPITINGYNGFIVHWGANVFEVVNAVRNLLKQQPQSSSAL